jgi:hypothetical protein
MANNATKYETDAMTVTSIVTGDGACGFHLKSEKIELLLTHDGQLQISSDGGLINWTPGAGLFALAVEVAETAGEKVNEGRYSPSLLAYIERMVFSLPY